jgi:hypothetical protein
MDMKQWSVTTSLDSEVNSKVRRLARQNHMTFVRCQSGRRLRTLGVLITALTAFSIATPLAASALGSGGDGRGRTAQWTPRPPLHHARAGLGAANVDGQILAVGGFTGGANAFQFAESRRAAGPGTWHDVRLMPTARGYPATAALKGRLYAVGGYDPNPVAVVETFDSRSGRWTTGRPLPQPRGAAGIATMDGLLYVAGGQIKLPNGTLEVTNSVLVYDPRKGAWRYIAPMHTPREKSRLVQSGRYLYVLGGADRAGRSLASMERYDPVSDSWQFMKSMHESRYATCAVESRVGNRRVLVVIAGVQAVDFMTVGGGYTTEIFDIDTGRWAMLKTLFSSSRGGHGCAVEADGTILAIGGATRTGTGLAFLCDVDALSLKPKDLG